MSCGLLGRMRAYVSSVYTRRGWRAGVGERVLIKLLAIVCRAVCPQPPAPSSGGGAHVWYDCFFEETVEETLKLTATLVQGENDLRTFTENSQISTHERELVNSGKKHLPCQRRVPSRVRAAVSSWGIRGDHSCDRLWQAEPPRDLRVHFARGSLPSGQDDR